MKATFRKVERARCIGSAPWQWSERTLGGALCAGGGETYVLPEACPGDSGGGLFAGTVLYGTVSAGDVTNGVCSGNLRPTIFSGMFFNSDFFGGNVTTLPRSNAGPSAPPPPTSGQAVRAPNVKFLLLLLMSLALFF